MVIPGNFIDIETGEALVPVYRFQDAMQIWHEKPLHKCTQLELWNFSTMLWNVSMQREIELQAAKVGDVKMTKYLFTRFGTVIGQENCRTTREKSLTFQEILPITYKVEESIFLYFDGKELTQSYSVKDFSVDSAIVDAMKCGYFDRFMLASGFQVFVIT